MRSKILLIYTGGTIGMKHDENSGSLKPFDFSQIYDEFPYFKKLSVDIDIAAFEPIDSSNVTAELWIALSRLIKERYDEFDGFVILHGTDTMSYTASALSFMLKNLGKAVILTGSQIPIGVLRTDGRENLMTAIEIAAAQQDGHSVIPEVAIYFQNRLFRGNRTSKQSAEALSAFTSDNYPPLAEVGVHISFNYPFIAKPTQNEFSIDTNLDSNVVIIKIFPSLSENVLKSILNIQGLKGVILETYGSGNAPTSEWFIDALEAAISKGIIIVNITQCQGGSVAMELYQTGEIMHQIGVVSGGDMTTEAAITKLSYLLGCCESNEDVKKYMKIPVRGEMSI